jgi:DNA-binding NarL/FixJ family response regulator
MGRLARVCRDFCPLGSVIAAAYSSCMKTDSEVSVLIIDEHTGISPLLAERLSLVPGIRVIGETANVMLGAELAHQFMPEIILADFRRTGPPRAETYRWLARVSPTSRVVAHTSYLPNGGERALREAGVTRCLLKGGSVEALAAELRQTLNAADKGPTNGPKESEE